MKAQFFRQSLLAAALTLCSAATVLAETKICIRFDPGIAREQGYFVRIKEKDAEGKEIARADTGSQEWVCIDKWSEHLLPTPKDTVREYCLEVLDSSHVQARFKLAVDVPQAIRFLNHEPGTLRELTDKERGSITITLHYPPSENLGKESKERYNAATGKPCPELLASVSCSDALLEGQPVLHSELRQARAQAAREYDVYYSSLEVARCVRLFSVNEASPIADYHPAVVRRYDNWMTRNFQTLGDKTLADVALPGTHDSGAYVLSDRKSPDLSAGAWLAGLGFNVIKPWAKTQHLDIKHQLDGGIRWLDMRTAYDGSDFYFYHAVLGPKTRDMLRQIRAFIDEPGHEHELIELEFCNWQGLGRDTPDEVWQRLNKMILTELGEQNVYRKDAPHTAKTETELLQTRLDDIVTGVKSRVVVFFQGHTEHAPFAFDANAAYGGMYANSPHWLQVEEDQRAKLAAHQPGKLFVLSWTVTANQEMFATDLANRGSAANPPFDLEYLTRGGQGNSMRGIVGWPGHEKINIVICDFFDTSPILPVCLKLNGIQPH